MNLGCRKTFLPPCGRSLKLATLAKLQKSASAFSPPMQNLNKSNFSGCVRNVSGFPRIRTQNCGRSRVLQNIQPWESLPAASNIHVETSDQSIHDLHCQDQCLCGGNKLCREFIWPVFQFLLVPGHEVTIGLLFRKTMFRKTTTLTLMKLDLSFCHPFEIFRKQLP